MEINEVIYAGAHPLTEKLNGKPKKFTKSRVNKKSPQKKKIRKGNKLTEGRSFNTS